MVEFNYVTTFQLDDENRLENWIEKVASNQGFEVGEINYIFCDDEYLHKLNVEFLQHDTLTDVISFDNTLGKLINGDIYISVERVTENAKEYNDSFDDELHRVMIHGVLHYMGFKDKDEVDIKQMRNAENTALLLLNN
ncbi:rRNA maturation RNase YbeY [Polaribacter sp. KT25b]|uniref:rRNA maturation RNase YbeY n=1 Tax=Polaribacter sp. KT25b TaxID=1855336 RepID=UPI00087C6BEE|nr:rRNA maturation RNase YbeY [Polaribacter sp. KT25b]SDS52619.1 rRNA maturation RNase YbeY [Polaribacter sp. KT25b]